MSDPIKDLRAQVRKSVMLLCMLFFLAGVANQLIVPLFYFLAIISALFLLRMILRRLLRNWL